MGGLKEEIIAKGLAEVLEGIPLRELTSMRIGGPAPLLLRPSEEGSLQELLFLLWERGERVRVLGGGTNLLVSDAGPREVVLDLRSMPKVITMREGVVWCTAPVKVAELLHFCAQRGLGGLEELAGIPGTLGGAIRGNAGAWGREVGEAVLSLVTFDPKGRRHVRGRSELSFSYRRGPLAEGEVLWEVGLGLREAEPEEVRERTAQFLRERQRRQPMGPPSAGCIFKNPVGAPPAGYLIEEAGFKGRQRGGARVSEVHANFIVNVGGATFSDVMGLIEEIRGGVLKAFGVELELEVEVWS